MAQLKTFTFSGTWVIGNLVTVTYGTKSWSYAITSTAIATFLPLLKAAYNALDASDYPEYAEQTADSTSTTLTLTADSPGKPFAVTLATNSAAGLIDGAASSTGTDTVANSGPNSATTAANWSAATVPIAGDTVVIDDPTYPILYDLDQNGVTLAVREIRASFEGDDTTAGTIGLPLVNTDHNTAYPEYRDTYWRISATLDYIGAGPGNGSGRLKLDRGSVAGTCYVYRTGSSPDSGQAALLLKGTSASNVVNVVGTSEVGVALLGGETANVTGGAVIGPGAVVRFGSGVTIATLTNNGGEVEVNGAIGTALVQQGGSAVINGTGAVALVNAVGGVVVYNTSGTLGGSCIIGGTALLDFTQDQRVKTVSAAIDLFGTSAQILDGLKVVTGGSGLIVDFNEGASPTQVDWGVHVRLTRGAVA